MVGNVTVQILMKLQNAAVIQHSNDSNFSHSNANEESINVVNKIPLNLNILWLLGSEDKNGTWTEIHRLYLSESFLEKE